MERNNVVVLKVRRDHAGTTVPFDKIYFFKRKDRSLIPKIFDYAIVLPIDDTLIEQIMKLIPKEVSHHKFVRDDDEIHMETGLDGRRTNADKEIARWWREEFFSKFKMEKRVAVVPMLVSKRRKKQLPRYITAPRWFNKQRVKEGNRHVLPSAQELLKGVHELAYLSTPLPAPHDKIQPICNVCPRQLLQLNGECEPGMPICYKTLDLNQILNDEEKEQVADAGVQ